MSEELGHGVQILPLSIAQRGLWVAQKIGPADATYNIAEYVEIRGELDAGLFLAALRQVAAEAETLRTRIEEQDGDVHQVVMPFYSGDFPCVDVSGEPDPRGTAERWMQEELNRPLDLARDPLWACALFQLAPDRHFWYHRCHHIVLDGFSGGMIARRVAEIYTAHWTGSKAPPCPFAPLSSLIDSERDYRDSTRFTRDQEYWLAQLADLPDAVSLAPRRVPASGGLRRATARISAQSALKLQEIGQQTGSSLPQTLIALIAAYFYRATGADDLVFGMPVSARPSPRLRSVPGMAANAVPIRLALSPDATLEQLLVQVAKAVRHSLRHQQYRYEDLRRELGLLAQGRQISWLGINIEPFDYDLRFGECTTSLHNLCNGAIEDLTVFVYDRLDGQGLRIDFDANPALYTEAELAAHQARLLRLMDALIAAPNQPISRLEILEAEERRRILHDWNAPAVPPLTLVELFEAQVARSPDAVAVRAGERSLTYAELNRVANTWAYALIGRGIGPGQRVALAAARDEYLPAALLAVLKTGAAYLPLDPEFPAERLHAMLSDARPTLLLACPDVAGLLPESGVPLFILERPAGDRAGTGRNPGDADRLGPLNGAALAYVIYTSGSTGRPKGIAIPHSALSNFLGAMQDALRLTPSDRWLAVTTVSFDIAALELYLPLIAGASVCIAQRETVRHPAALAELVSASGATLMQATPSLWRALLPDHAAALAGLRPLVGGEALPGHLARALRALGHPVINLYGPTETTVWSTLMVLDEPRDLEAPAIGRPLRNTQVYVLDRVLQPVPPGVPGDLYIGGDGLAVGYLNQPDLTAQRFISNPFGPVGSRLYQTGDQARWRADGVLEFLGRSDHQVKIRGFRIETGEIESALTDLASVREALVIAHAAPGGEQRLVAYVVAEGGEPDSAELRRQLGCRLPDYMLPSAFVFLSAFPQTANGKVDRKALPAPLWQTATGYVAPRTPSEEMLASLWAETLGVARVGIHDNFFELGGDSLSAARIVARIRAEFDCELPLGALFNAATIAQLAAELSLGNRGNPLDVLLPIRTRGDAAPLFCVHPVLGLGWGYAGLLRHLPAGVPLYALQARGLQGAKGLPTSIEAMAADYVSQIRAVQPRGPYRLLGWSLGGLVAHAMTAILEAAGEKVTFLAMLDAYPFLQTSAAAAAEEAELVEACLAFLGYDVQAMAQVPAQLPALAEFLCREYDVLAMPVVQEMQKSNARIVDQVQAVIRSNLALARHYHPGMVSAPLHFFVATLGKTARAGAFLDQHAQAWRAYVGGKIQVYELAFHHQDMLSPAALDIVGPALAAALSGPAVGAGEESAPLLPERREPLFQSSHAPCA